MYKTPQAQRAMKLVLILAGIALILSLIVAAFVPEIFIVALIFIAFIVGIIALGLKVFEWICFGSND